MRDGRAPPCRWTARMDDLIARRVWGQGGTMRNRSRRLVERRPGDKFVEGVTMVNGLSHCCRTRDYMIKKLRTKCEYSGTGRDNGSEG